MSKDTTWTPRLTFALRLKVLRGEYGNRLGHPVTVEEIASLCGVTRSAWSQWERGACKPRDLIPTISRISKKTGVDPQWLLAISDDDDESAAASTRCYVNTPKDGFWRPWESLV